MDDKIRAEKLKQIAKDFFTDEVLNLLRTTLTVDPTQNKLVLKESDNDMAQQGGDEFILFSPRQKEAYHEFIQKYKCFLQKNHSNHQSSEQPYAQFTDQEIRDALSKEWDKHLDEITGS